MTRTPEWIVEHAIGRGITAAEDASETAANVIRDLLADHYVIVYREPIAREDVREGDAIREEWEEISGTKASAEWVTSAEALLIHSHRKVFLTASRKPQIPDEPGVRFDAKRGRNGLEITFVTLADGTLLRQSHVTPLTRDQFIADGWEVVE